MRYAIAAKGLAVALAAGLGSASFTGVSSASVAEVVSSATPEAIEPALEQDLSTATSNTTQEPDGTYTLQSFTEAVNYQDASGTWLPIDNALVDSPGTLYDVENAANSFTAKIPADASTTPVRFENLGQWVSMQMHGLDNEATIEGEVATFNDVTKAASVTYTVVGEGLKENIVLNTPPSTSEPLKYKYTIKAAAGVTPRTTFNGGIEFLNSERQLVAALPPGTMSDSADLPTVSTGIQYDMVPTDVGWTLTMTVDSGWLRDPAREYPVLIDPSLTNQPATKDCWLQSASPNTSGCTNNDYLRTGRSDGTHRYRSILDFSIISVPDEAEVNTAAVGLYLDTTKSYSSAQTEYSLFATSKKFDNGATWNTSGLNGGWSGGSPTGAAMATKSLGGSGPSGYRIFSDTLLKSQYQKWIWNRETKTGLLLQQSGDPVNNILYFASSSAISANNGKRPYLTLNYTFDDSESVDANVAETGVDVLNPELLSLGTTTQTVTTDGVAPDCTPINDPNDEIADDEECKLLTSVTMHAPDTVDGEGVVRSFNPSTQSGRAAYTEKVGKGDVCVKTGCFQFAYRIEWEHQVCVFKCSLNKVEHKGLFYSTPDGSFVWETVKHGGLKGWHSCYRVKTMPLVSMEIDRCTAPRISNAQVNSRMWFYFAADTPLGGGPGQLYLATAHHKNFSTTRYLKEID